MKKAKAKREAPKAEAVPTWFLLDANGNPCWRSLITPHERAKRIRDGQRYAFMVPADPLADAALEKLRAWAKAERAWRDTGEGGAAAADRRETELLETAEALEQRK